MRKKTLISPIGKALLLSILTLTPAFAQDLNMAQLLEQGGQIETAFKIYKDGLRKNPDQPLALNGFIRTGRSLKRYDTLLAVLETVKPLARNPAAIELGIVEALFGLKRRSEATSRLDRLLRSYPDRLTSAIEILTRNQEFALAIRYLEPAIDTGFTPELADRLTNLYEQTGRLVSAAGLMARIANTGSVNGAARYLIRSSERLRFWGKHPAASRILTELEKIQNPALRTQTKAQVLLGANREVEAARLFENAFKDRAVTKQDLFQFARESEQTGYYHAALAIYQFLGLYADAARILRRQGKIELALKTLESDTTPNALFEYGEIARLEKKDFPQAASAYRRFLWFRPDDPLGICGLTEALIGLKQLDSAHSLLTRINPPDDRALYLRAKIWLYQGRFDSANATVQEFTRRFPDSPLLNDLLQVGILTMLGEEKSDLITIMYHLDAGEYETALHRAKTLSAGNNLVAQQALMLMSEIFLRQNQPEPAVAVLDTLLTRFPTGELAAFALFQQADIIRNYLKDPQRFIRTANRLIEQFPNSPLVPLIRNQLLSSYWPPAGPLH